MAASREPRRDESEDEKADRHYNELLQELRVAQTGVQFLFAFLLTLAFTQRFPQITDFQHWVYVSTLTATAIASALLSRDRPTSRGRRASAMSITRTPPAGRNGIQLRPASATKA